MVQQMLSDNNHDVNVDVISAVATSESSSICHCLMCNSTVHLFNACPKVSDLNSDMQCIVFSGLLQAHNFACSNNHHGSASCNTQSHVHAITTEVNSIPDKASAVVESLTTCIVTILMCTQIFSRPIS